MVSHRNYIKKGPRPPKIFLDKDGYPRWSNIKVNNQAEYIHRWLWKLINGPIPDGHDIHHKDGNRINLDPQNLECFSRNKHMLEHRLKDDIYRVRDKKGRYS